MQVRGERERATTASALPVPTLTRSSLLFQFDSPVGGHPTSHAHTPGTGPALVTPGLGEGGLSGAHGAV